MKHRTTDLRVLRTKELIRNSLVELMEEKGFEAITVKDITVKAKINRGTFYAHYQDKYDLMTKCQEEMMQEMSNIVKQNFPKMIANLKTDSSSLVSFTPAVLIFAYLNENSGFVKAALSPKGDLSFQIKLKEFIWNLLLENSPYPLIKKENLLVPVDYLVSYITSAHLGVIQQWLNGGRKETPEEMAQILSTITMNGPFFAAGLKK
ncbi:MULTISPECIES: TetR/AcrR family transcriptional regulator [Bacillaceae]|nr:MULTISPECIES: TetR/AcrR family transcriptional regulator C-terminal domain-containing protein [Bacillaceae]